MGTFEYIEFPQDAFPEDALADDSVIGEEEGGSPGGLRYDRTAAIIRDDDEVLLMIAHIARIL